MKISIIIPVFNERDTVFEVIRRILSVDFSSIGLKREVVIIDDGSTDGTQELLKRYQSKNEPANDIKVIFHEKNMGKGAAIRTGFAAASGEIFAIQDADLELIPEELPLLLSPIVEGKAKVVFGSRFGKKVKGINPSTLFANKIFTFFTNLLYGAQITDMMTCYKVMHRDVVKTFNLRSNRFDIEPEITAKICKSGYKIYEVPISYNPRKFTSGKKIAFGDSFSVIWALLKYRFFD